MSWLIIHYHTGRRQWSYCSMPMIRLQEVELLVSESLRTAKSLNVVKWFSFIDCTISMPSVIEAFEVNAGISVSSVKPSGQCDSSLLEKSALLSFLIVPLLKSVEEWWWYCNQLVVEDFPHVYVMNHGDCQKPPKQYISVKYQLLILSVVRAFVISHTSTPCISLEVPRIALRVFLITVP